MTHAMRIADVRFLVVEDHEFQRLALARMLAGLGAQHIVEASDGRAALGLMQAPAQPIDIIISDLDMPGMDGMEFMRHVGEAGATVSMILSSVHDRALIASVATMAEAYGIRLLGTIEKPITPSGLAALIARHQPYAGPQSKPARKTFSEADITAALAARLFEPLFQPKVEVATGRLAGAEALARWYHPEQGIVGPYAFIPALEANRRIDELTWIILEHAAAACREWRERGLECSVSVNLSLRSLSNVGFADRVTALVREQCLEPRHVVLEVTETIAMTDIAHALENLARLRIKGFGLSIDDYGTGYSSMQQLARIAFTEVKIDQSFVTNADEKESCRVILESSLDMARKLGLKAVAEGVESRADWELLKKLGCDVAQGYFIARPMRTAEFVAWARDWAAPQ